MKNHQITIKMVKGNTPLTSYQIKSITGAITVFAAGNKEYRAGDSVLELDAKDLAAHYTVIVTTSSI